MLETKVIQKAIVMHEGKMLLLKRSKTDVRRPLQWDLPGGLLDPGEDLIEGVSREVQEEAGLTLNSPKVVFSQNGIREWKDTDGAHKTNNVWIYYAGKVTNDDVTLSFEHSEYVWVTIQDAIEMIEYDLQIDALRWVVDNNLEL